jgi:hypothetical protein
MESSKSKLWINIRSSNFWTDFEFTLENRLGNKIKVVLVFKK